MFEFAIERLFASHADTWGRLYTVVSRFFVAESTGKTYTRKPALKITLLPDGEPPARVVIEPDWELRYGKKFDPAIVRIAMLSGLAGSRTTRNILLKVTLKNRSAWGVVCGNVDCGNAEGRLSMHRYDTDDMSRLAELAEAFLADPLRVFARSKGYCCICWKTLTDPVSQARGIGPECFHKVTGFTRVAQVRQELQESLSYGG